MSDEQRNTIWRFAIIFIVITLGFVAVLVKIAYIQTVERDEWLKVAEKQVPTVRPITATRGNILDCNGRLLASSMPQYYMYMDTRVPALHEKKGALFTAHVDSLAKDLANSVGGHSQAEYKARIVQAYRKGEKRLKVCDHRINYLQRQELEQNALIKKGKYRSGIFFEDQHRRIKPYGLLASRTIGGIYGKGGGGNSGLEKRFDKDFERLRNKWRTHGGWRDAEVGKLSAEEEAVRQVALAKEEQAAAQKALDAIEENTRDLAEKLDELLTAKEE